MEREIKFRALKDDMSNCNWMYGKLVYDAIGQPRITEVDSSGQGVTFHTCIKGTEGQFTGKKDSKDVDIYEDDIIEFDKREWGGDDNIHVVEWDEDNAEWSWGVGTTSDMVWRTVIGNIHENPDLLNNSRKGLTKAMIIYQVTKRSDSGDIEGYLYYTNESVANTEQRARNKYTGINDEVKPIEFRLTKKGVLKMLQDNFDKP